MSALIASRSPSQAEGAVYDPRSTHFASVARGLVSARLRIRTRSSPAWVYNSAVGAVVRRGFPVRDWMNEVQRGADGRPHGRGSTARRGEVLLPTVLRLGPSRFFFFSGEGLEPAHIHVQRDRALAKFWLAPVSLASSCRFGGPEL